LVPFLGGVKRKHAVVSNRGADTEKTPKAYRYKKGHRWERITWLGVARRKTRYQESEKNWAGL